MRLLLLFVLSFSLVAQIPGTFRVTGPVAPPATNSNFGATLPVYGTGGLLTGLSSLSQLQDTNRYPVARRHAGQVARLTNGAEYTLGSDLVSWYNSGSVSNLAALLAIEPATAGGVVTVDNYSTSGDLGGGPYTLVSTITGTNAIGGKLTAIGGTMAWQFTGSTIPSRAFGITDGSTNYTSFQTWLDYCAANNAVAFQNYGIVGIPATNSVLLTTGLIWRGEPGAQVLRMGIPSTTNSHVYSLVKTSLAFNPFQTNGGFLGSNITATISNIVLDGITFGTYPGYNSTFGVALFGTENVTVKNCRFNVFTNHWALTIFGNKTRIINNTIRNAGAVFQDGIHWIGGDGGEVVGNDVESGDDALAFTLSWYTQPDIRRISASGNKLSSSHAHAIRFDSESIYWGSNVIENISIAGSTGLAGEKRNGILRMESNASLIQYPVRNITIDGSTVMAGGLAGHGGTAQGSAYGYYVEDSTGVVFNNIVVADTPWRNFNIKDCGSVTITGSYLGGAQDTFFNTSLFADNVASLVLVGNQIFNRNSVSSDTVWLKGTLGAIVGNNLIQNDQTNKACVLVNDGATMDSFVANGNILTNSIGTGFKFLTTPNRIAITGNSIYSASASTNGLAIQWATGVQPSTALVGFNWGYYRPPQEFSYAITNSSLSFVGSIDIGKNDYLRFIATNGVIVFGQNNQTTNTSETIRLAAKTPLNQTPIGIAVVTDNGTFSSLTFGGGSSQVAGARQLSLSTTLTNYTAGTERVRLTSTGSRFQPDGVSANPSSDAAMQIVSTNTGFRLPAMTTAQRFSIGLQGAGVKVFDTDFNREFVALSSNTNSWRMLGGPTVAPDQGDTSITINGWQHNFVFPFATTLTANRTVSLSTIGAISGDTVTIVRTGLGAFTLDVSGLKTIPSATAATVTVQYNGSAWVLIGYQLL